MQFNLSFLDLPVPQASVWLQLDDEQRTIVSETVARLITKMILAEIHQEENNDR